jgi:hypothetical protein
MKTIIMTDKDTFRFETMNDLIQHKIEMQYAMKVLNLSKRQVKRIRKRIRKEGTEGVIHKGRGQRSNRKMIDTIRTKVEKLLKERYHDFGPTFAAEKLRDHHLILSKETVRMILMSLDLHTIKHRKGNGQYHAWRPRKECYGEMEQFDGSYHLWFEDRSDEHCLLASIDDATGRITKAVFAQNEGVHEVSKFWKEYVEEHGVPQSIYLDKFSTYKVNHVHAVDNYELLTQFQQMTQRILITLITAHSPEAKGRIERLFKTLQDRLVKEMRLLGISTPAEGNEFLRDVFIPRFNAQFSVMSAQEGDVHRPMSVFEKENLLALFSVQKRRSVSNDFCIQFENQWIQLERVQPTLVCRRDTVMIEKRIDGTLHVKLREIYLKFHLLSIRPTKLREKVTALVSAPVIRVPNKPQANHPWRHSVSRKVEFATT